MTSKPLPVAGRPLGETHVLRSEKLDMKMRPGGKEIETRGRAGARHAGVPAQSAGAASSDADRQGHGDRLRRAESHRVVPRPSTCAPRPIPRRTRRSAIASTSVTTSKRWKRASTRRPARCRRSTRRAISPMRRATARRAPPKASLDRRSQPDRAGYRRAHVGRERHRPPPTRSAWTSAPATSPPRAT